MYPTPQKTFFVCFDVLETGVFSYSLGHPRTPSVDHAGLELGDLLASASNVLGLQVHTTTSCHTVDFLKEEIFSDQIPVART